MPTEAGPKLLQDWICRAAARDPAKAWAVSAEDGQTVSYGQLHDLTRRIAALLHRRGLGRNDRVAGCGQASARRLPQVRIPESD